MGKRIVLFLLTNILIVLMISFVVQFFGLAPRMNEYGYDYQSLAIFCLVWGMGGAFISLLLSKKMAKWMMKLQIIDPKTSNPTERWLIDSVYRLAEKSRLPKMPEVAIYQSAEVNAFATGPSKRNSLVAVSSGLVNRMNKDEVEGVLGHEIAHIANGDMVTMTLLQGVVNAFVMFAARIAAFAVTQALRGNDSRDSSALATPVSFVLIIVFQIIFGILGSVVVCWFSRHREFRADIGGATLAGRQKMISALQRLGGTTELVDNSQPAMATLKISDKKSWMALLSTHPSLETRIARLERAQIV